MFGRILALVAGCVLAAQAIGAQQATIEQRLRPDIAARVGGGLNLKSTSALVLDQSGQRVLYAKNVDWVVPIASITKLMTAMVVLDSGLPLDEPIKITKDDRDGLKHTRSRLGFGMSVRRDDLLRLALMASENRAAAALARAYPGGTPAFVAAMNHKAAELGMWRSRFVDGTGLSSGNVSNCAGPRAPGGRRLPLSPDTRVHDRQPAHRAAPNGQARCTSETRTGW